MSTEIITQQKALEYFSRVRNNIVKKTEEALSINIADDNTLSIAKSKGKELSDISKQVEAVRIELKEPHMVNCKMIDAAAKIIKTPVDEAIKKIKDDVLKYENSKPREIIDSIDEKVSLINSGPKTQIRKTWAFELVNKNAVPFEWLTLDEEKVKAYLSENKDKLTDGQFVKGVKFYQKETVVL